MSLDAYETRPEVALAICQRLMTLLRTQPSTILDPSAGTGGFLKAAREVWGCYVTLCGVEIQEDCKPSLEAITPLKNLRFGPWEHYYKAAAQMDLIIGNPPYSLAEDHSRLALRVMRPGTHLAFLLRVGFIAGKKRWAGLYQEFPLRYFIPITPRPGFIYKDNSDGQDTDMSEYALFVWEKGYSGYAEVTDAIRWVRS